MDGVSMGIIQQNNRNRVDLAETPMTGLLNNLLSAPKAYQSLTFDLNLGLFDIISPGDEYL